MDKETLSNYGWIVICVMVLAVMLAFASPFGNFVADAIKSTTQGLFDVNQGALDAAGIQIMEQEFDTMLNGETETVPVFYEEGDYRYVLIKEGFSTLEEEKAYVLELEITPWLEYEYGMTFEEFLATEGITESEFWEECGLTEDTFVASPSNAHWTVGVIDKTKSAYGRMKDELFGYPVTDLTSTFVECENLIVAPELSVNATDMCCTFKFCSSLTTAPTIPSGVTAIDDTFAHCSSLTDVAIPETVTELGASAFQNTAITTITIPNSVKTIDTFAFYGCTGLTSINIPLSVTKLNAFALDGCCNIATITYAGTVEQWNNITLVNNWNLGVPATQVICSNGTVNIK